MAVSQLPSSNFILLFKNVTNMVVGWYHGEVWKKLQVLKSGFIYEQLQIEFDILHKWHQGTYKIQPQKL